MTRIAARGPAREEDGTLVFLERYGPGFDRCTGRGDIEVWIPVK